MHSVSDMGSLWKDIFFLTNIVYDFAETTAPRGGLQPKEQAAEIAPRLVSTLFTASICLFASQKSDQEYEKI